jgi:DNA-binding NarL/FixJ family response regulator
LADVDVVDFAETAGEAITLLALHGSAWQLAIVDMFLREGSGLTVVRACQSREPWQRVVVLSNYATAEIRRRCIELGADAVFDKSNDIEDFIAYCNRLEDSRS